MFCTIRSAYKPEGRQAKCVNRRTDYEGPAAPWYFSGCPVLNLMGTDWAKRGGRVSRRFFGDFLCVQKVTRVRAGEAREVEGRFRPLRNPLGSGGGALSESTGRGGEAPKPTPV